ncbi:hypothetical protein V5799_017331 [Amblyomma americanum]|uniref:Uncharacterized protein n=1 Tax=Amblyomma americanum TaxID=6943 RepID=A0AAQ4F2K5_AMBAM
MARNVATFLWRTLYVQAICRDYVYTALELASVPLLAYVFEPPQAPVVPLGTDAGEVDLMRVLVPEQLPTHVVFGPDTSYNLELMTQVDSEIRKALHVTTYKG